MIKKQFFCFFSILFAFSADAKIKEKSESETYTEQELLEKDQEVRVAAFKTGCQVAGTAAAVALTPPPANVLVGAAGACAIHDSYTVGKEAENDLAAMHAHNARATTAKDRNHEWRCCINASRKRVRALGLSKRAVEGKEKDGAVC